jgi:hypothetical protein
MFLCGSVVCGSNDHWWFLLSTNCELVLYFFMQYSTVGSKFFLSHLCDWTPDRIASNKIRQSSIWYGGTMGQWNDCPTVWWFNVYLDKLGIIQWDNRPVNLHPLFLKMGHPAFWKIGHPAFWKKQVEKYRVILYSKWEETRLPLLFLNYSDLGFLHSVFFKKQGAWFSKSREPNF